MGLACLQLLQLLALQHENMSIAYVRRCSRWTILEQFYYIYYYDAIVMTCIML